MTINTNINSLQIHSKLTHHNKMASSSLEKLTSGMRINKASDDASGLAISDELRMQASSIAQGLRNANDGISMIQMADMAMSEQSNILDIIKTKLIQAKSDTTNGEGISSISQDIQKLLDNLDQIASNTNYNGTTLLQAGRFDKDISGGFVFQLGGSGVDKIAINQNNLIAVNTGKSETHSTGLANGTLFNLTKEGRGNFTLTFDANGKMLMDGQQVSAVVDAEENRTYTPPGDGNILFNLGEALNSLTEVGLGKEGNAVKIAINEYVSAKMANIDIAISDLNKVRSEFGSTQVQLQSAAKSLSVAHVNIKNSESGIRDLDYASEVANFTRENIQIQTGDLILSQANAETKKVLDLFK